MQRSGKRNHRVVVQWMKGATRDAIGGVVENWIELGSRWCNVRPSEAREQVRADKQEGIVNTVAELPYDPALKALHPSMRVVHDGKTLYVVGIVADEVGRQTMALQLSESR